MSDFFEINNIGAAFPYNDWPRRARFRDSVFDTIIQFRGGIRSISTNTPLRRKILVAGVSVPKRSNDIVEITEKLKISLHEVHVSIAQMGNNGKFKNINAAIMAAPFPLDQFDWLLIVDDDIKIKNNFLDQFIAIIEAANFTICQPAHCFNSYASWAITQRSWGALARETRFVEIGPLTAIKREAFAELVPFPESRWCYGVDAYWSQVAEQRGWAMGICDATPVRHLRPVGASYKMNEAVQEGREFLKSRGVSLDRSDILKTEKIVIRW